MSLGPEPATSTLVAAANWLEGMVQGPLSVTLAVLAIAATGLMMLSGRIAIRRGLIMTLGCFIMFGAPVIARGIMNSAISIAEINSVPQPSPSEVTNHSISPPPTRPAVADPYAGASISQ